jgi:flagellin-specific chaperone FliS
MNNQEILENVYNMSLNILEEYIKTNESDNDINLCINDLKDNDTKIYIFNMVNDIISRSKNVLGDDIDDDIECNIFAIFDIVFKYMFDFNFDFDFSSIHKNFTNNQYNILLNCDIKILELGLALHTQTYN